MGALHPKKRLSKDLARAPIPLAAAFDRSPVSEFTMLGLLAGSTGAALATAGAWMRSRRAKKD